MPEIAQLTYGGAVNAALRYLLDSDPRVLVYGEDVAEPGGVFGVTRGLRQSFGPGRVFDTPISESAILGSAVGSALMGCRPIVEIMWADFALVALDQLVNQAANARYVSRGSAPAPIVVRTQQGNAPGACAQHSQCLEAFFLHTPGLRVAMPSTPQDAYDALIAAATADDPVIVVENRTLYAGRKEPVELRTSPRRMGWSAQRRTGTGMTVVTWGAMTHRVLRAAEALDADGIDIDVLEMVWLNPLDIEAVLDSVTRTGRLAVVHEANRTGGFGAEIVARVVEAGVPLLAPPVRIATPDTRLPAAPSLATALVPSADSIASDLRAAVSSPVAGTR
ncbi:transketolase C-terminal domain-containing protein [Kribbella sp. NPDC050281]|uniref:alpha-ketoacid dehydrogenase subunit beta n=1 Tax=Kribbella sp. NPDC050281 TaxID=3155515 RepID=UPI0033DEC701